MDLDLKFLRYIYMHTHIYICMHAHAHAHTQAHKQNLIALNVILFLAHTKSGGGRFIRPAQSICINLMIQSTEQLTENGIARSFLFK